MFMRFERFFLILILIFSAGCASHRSTPSRQTVLPAPRIGGSSFSDENSREMIRETRKLLTLKERDYLIGSDDVLNVSIFEWETTESSSTLALRVSKSGFVAVPALGRVYVKDRSVEEVQELLVETLESKGVLQQPRVGVSIAEYRSRRISVVGAVLSPGVYALQENVTSLIDILSLAGGPATSAGSLAYVLRAGEGLEDPVPLIVQLDDLFKTGKAELNAVLQDGDVVYVPIAPTVYIYGSITAPGGISLNQPTTLLEAISLAGGFTSRADKRNVVLQRSLGGGNEQSVVVDLAAIEGGDRPDYFLQEGDVIKVANAPEKSFMYGIWDVFRSIVSVSYRINPSNE